MKGQNTADVLQTLGAGLVVLGIIFSENSLVSYTFMGAGVVLQIVSLIIRRRTR